SRPRRKSIWATSQSSNVALNPGVTITPIDLLAGLEAGGVGIVGGTVTRIHAWLSFSGADTDANPSFIWGMTMWDKSSVGTTNPNVTSDFYIDWLMLREGVTLVWDEEVVALVGGDHEQRVGLGDPGRGQVLEERAERRVLPPQLALVGGAARTQAGPGGPVVVHVGQVGEGDGDAVRLHVQGVG